MNLIWFQGNMAHTLRILWIRSCYALQNRELSYHVQGEVTIFIVIISKYRDVNEVSFRVKAIRSNPIKEALGNMGWYVRIVLGKIIVACSCLAAWVISSLLLVDEDSVLKWGDVRTLSSKPFSHHLYRLFSVGFLEPILGNLGYSNPSQGTRANTHTPVIHYKKS